MFKKLIFIIFYLNVIIFSQAFIYRGDIGEFTEATSFSINYAGMIYAADAGENEIYKLDTLGNILVNRGGYGWEAATFDYPADIFATTLRVSVADKNNHRIQIFDKDLTFLSEFTTRDNEDPAFSFAYPAASATSNQGDLYVLDSDNSRILKYDITGKYLQEIGNFDAGNYALSNPKTFAITPDGKILVLDSEKIVVFDQYGAGLQVFNPGIEADNLNITFSNLVINNKKSVKYIDLDSKPLKFKEFTPGPDLFDSDIIEALIFRDKLYILTEKKIMIFQSSIF